MPVGSETVQEELETSRNEGMFLTSIYRAKWIPGITHISWNWNHLFSLLAQMIENSRLKKLWRLPVLFSSTPHLHTTRNLGFPIKTWLGSNDHSPPPLFSLSRPPSSSVWIAAGTFCETLCSCPCPHAGIQNIPPQNMPHWGLYWGEGIWDSTDSKRSLPGALIWLKAETLEKWVALSLSPGKVSWPGRSWKVGTKTTCTNKPC